MEIVKTKHHLPSPSQWLSSAISLKGSKTLELVTTLGSPRSALHARQSPTPSLQNLGLGQILQAIFENSHENLFSLATIVTYWCAGNMYESIPKITKK